VKKLSDCRVLLVEDAKANLGSEYGGLRLLCGCRLSVKITEMAEGVGFEPTVSFPTLDFESSALNQTQPPFLSEQKNVER
jgi:hypothetical protein